MKCKNCNIGILGDKMACPLCGQVLPHKEDGLGENKIAMPINEYPDIRPRTKLLRRIVNAFAFFSVLAEVCLIVVNYKTGTDLWWSWITGGVLLYLYITLRYSIQNNDGYLMRIVIQSVGGILLTVWVDSVIGYQGWSVNYVIPSAIMMLNLTILILMLVNSVNWQSYILFQLFLLFINAISVVLYFAGIVDHPFLTFLAVGISLVIFVGTLIIGDRKATTELKRRFHI